MRWIGCFVSSVAYRSNKDAFGCTEDARKQLSFSEQSELREFASALNEIKIPYREISDTGINVSDEWKEQAEEIYEKFMESANE